MTPWEYILGIVLIVISIALIILVLFQESKQQGLSGAIAGGADNYLGKGKSKNMDQALASATKWVALAWVILTLSLSLI